MTNNPMRRLAAPIWLIAVACMITDGCGRADADRDRRVASSAGDASAYAKRDGGMARPRAGNDGGMLPRPPGTPPPPGSPPATPNPGQPAPAPSPVAPGQPQPLPPAGSPR